MSTLPYPDPGKNRDESSGAPTELPTPRPSAIYEQALIDARHYSADALQGFADVFATDAVDPDDDFPGETGRFLASERLRACQDDLARRDRLDRLNSNLPRTADRRYEQWRSLAQLLRDRVDIVAVFDACDYHLHDVGLAEAHAACPHCGGTDRLVIRRDPPGRCWCRHCGWSSDLISVTMSLRQAEFRDALTWLADLAGQAVLR